MNPKCNQSFTNLYGYNQHHTHARNANTLCASVTMRREIVVTRRAGATSSAVEEIAPKRVYRMLDHWLIMIGMTLALCPQKQLEFHSQQLKKLRKIKRIQKLELLVHPPKPRHGYCNHVGFWEYFGQN